MSTKSVRRVSITGRFVGGGLFEPRQQEEGKDPRYSACIVLDEGESQKVNAVIDAAIKEKWGGKKPPGLTVWGVREGDDPEFTASYGHEFINPKANKKPGTAIRRNGAMVEVTKEDDVIYPGCYIAASIEAYAYDGDKAKNIKPGVSLNLLGVMYRKRGERLDNPFDAESEFADFEVEEDEEDFEENQFG